MSYKVGFFLKANGSVYAVIREVLRPDCELVTPAGDPLEPASDLDF